MNLYINSRINFIKNVNLLYEKVERFDIMYLIMLNGRWRLIMTNFGDAERHIASLLSVGNEFTINGKTYVIKWSGKPTCKKGEPKTDIYVYAESDKDSIEVKISYKKSNADFIENKTTAERAEALFGEDWAKIIYSATKSIEQTFKSKKLIYKAKYKKTEAGAITLGWKYELMNKSAGELSGVVKLTCEQVIDVYAGTHISEEKKNANVNGKIIKDSGVANYILMNDNLSSTQEVIDNLVSIECYVDKYPTIYFACKALNYRTYKDKYDGNRPLSVYVDWSIKDGKLHSNLVFDNPLVIRGDFVANKLKSCLQQLNIKTTDDICDKIVFDPSIIIE